MRTRAARFISSPSDQRRDAALARAEGAIAIGRFPEALAAASEAIAADPRHGNARGLLAQALSGLERLQEALQAVEGGLAVDPENAWLHRMHGLLLGNVGRVREMLAEVNQSLRLEPESDNGHYLRSLALEALGRKEEARKAAERAVELGPEIPRNHCQQGKLCMELSAQRAEQCYRTALALAPEDVAALNGLSLALLRQRRDGEAAQVARSALQVDPALPAAHDNVRKAMRSLGSTVPMVAASIMVTVAIAVPLLLVLIILRHHLWIAALVALVGGNMLWAMIKAMRGLWRNEQKQRALVDPGLVEIHRKLEEELRRSRR